jgi:hypothetical protein
VAYAAETGQGSVGKFELKVCKLPGGAPTLDRAALEGRHTRRIVPPIFQQLKRLDQPGRRRTAAKNANDSAHG